MSKFNSESTNISNMINKQLMLKKRRQEGSFTQKILDNYNIKYLGMKRMNTQVNTVVKDKYSLCKEADIYFDETSQCVICLDYVKTEKFYLSCGHCFHNSCAISWLFYNKKCPLCNKKMHHYYEPTYKKLETLKIEKNILELTSLLILLLSLIFLFYLIKASS